VSIFSCKDTVRLVSRSLDDGLTLGQRLAVRVHLLGCSMCSRFRRQLLFLHRAAGQFETKSSARPDVNLSSLSPEARTRIQHVIEHENP
jgi:hypothetical protein